MKHYSLLNGIIYSFIGLFLTYTTFNLLIKSTNIKIIIVPFFIIGIIITLTGIIYILKDLIINSKRTDFDKIGSITLLQKLEQKSSYLYFITFLIFWFIMIILCDISAIKNWNNGGKTIFIISLLFWLVGIILLITIIKNIKKDK